ncbi:MAG TPA: glycosyltransferase [Acidimicrobiales bacterium]|nr:glycosyltransferase [Acidimicrobiales bacterium]
MTKAVTTFQTWPAEVISMGLTALDLGPRPTGDGDAPALLWPDFPEAPTAGDESTARSWVIRGVALLTALVTAAYLVWRPLGTMTHTALWLALPLYVFEVYAFANFAFFTFDLWELAEPLDPPPPRRQYRVAVLVPTYNEPREVLLPTLAAAVAIEGPHETWALDDGARPWVAQLAAELGVQYRARSDRSHAKAGNINAVLGELQARGTELVAVFDADHVAKRIFLARVVGYFNDPKVALVQTPQDYYNLDSFEHAHLRRGNRFGEQVLFFRVLSAARNRRNAAFWCGTGGVLRLSSLLQVGGIATETLTEDMHTTIRLHQAGWRSVYHNEVLARGLAAANWEQFKTQRQRWATGGMQILRVDNPLTAPGLSLAQRLSYFGGLFAWFYCWCNLVFVLLPLATVLTGAVPISAPVEVFVPAWLTTQLLQRASQRLLSRGTAPMWQSLVFSFLRMPALCSATLTVVHDRRRKFKVTPKGRDGGSRARITPPALLGSLVVTTTLALIWFCWCITGHGPLHYGKPAAVAWALGWSVFNGVALAAAAYRISSSRFATDRRASFRFALEGEVLIDGSPAVLSDLSLGGAQVVLPEADVTAGEELTLTLPCAQPPVELRAAVRSVRPSPTTWPHHGRPGPGARAGERPEVAPASIGLEFVGPSTAEVARLALALFRTGSSIEISDAAQPFALEPAVPVLPPAPMRAVPDLGAGKVLDSGTAQGRRRKPQLVP